MAGKYKTKRDKIHSVYSMLNKQNEIVANLRIGKDAAYRERNKVVSALTKLFPSCLGKHEDDPKWHHEWMNIVYITLPTGQVSWHLHDSDLPLFAHLELNEKIKWDGHTTEEKYERLLAL